MKNSLTIDVEDWYQTSDFKIDESQWNTYEDRIVENNQKLLDMLSRHGVKATFFILGTQAEKHPEMVRRISEEGHEIGSHGMAHRMVTHMLPEEFRKDTQRSKTILEDISGKACRLYRAPSWSVCRKNLWVLEILDELGFACDSSIQPFRTPLSGMNGVPHTPFHPVLNGKSLKLLEFPSTVLKMGKLVLPFAGGFYFRCMPYFLSSWALKAYNQQGEGMVYIHPWDLDPGQPRLKCPPHIRFEHYYNLKKTAVRLERLLKDFCFVPLGDLIKDRHYPAISL